MAKKDFDIDKEKDILIRAQQGDMAARREAHKMYSGMLDKISRPEAVRTGQPPIALRLEASKLLDHYIDSWDPTVPYKPSTYLYGNVQKKLSRYVNDRSQTVRTTEFYGVDIGKYTASVGELSQQLGRKPTDEEILFDMQSRYPEKKFTLEHIRRLRDSVRTSVLASGIIGSSDEGSTVTVGDLYFSTGDDEDIMHDMSVNFQLREMLKKVDELPEPERTIVLHTYGLNGYPQLSLRELAVKLGLNKYKVGVHLNSAMEKLRAGSGTSPYSTGFVPYGATNIGDYNPYD